MNSSLIQELKECNTFLEMVTVCNKYYCLDRKLGKIAKLTIIKQLPRMLRVIGAKKR